MKFNYETQGAVTYLVCELDPAEQLDPLTLGMLTNNHIAGLAPVLYTEMNGQRFLKYNVSAKVSGDQFFSGNMTKQRILTALQNILNALCSADEYMIDINCFSVVPEHIFINVSNCETALVCIPAVVEKNVNAETAEMINKILSSAQFASGEDTSFVSQLIAYVSDGPSFNVYGLKDKIAELMSAPSVSAFNGAPSMGMPSQPSIPSPVSSFDSTISIDDVPAGMLNTPSQPVQPQYTPQPVQPQYTPQPVQPQYTPQPVQQPQYVPQKPVQPQYAPQTPPVQPQVPHNNTGGFSPANTPAARPITPAAHGGSVTTEPKKGMFGGNNQPAVKPANNHSFAVPGQPFGVTKNAVDNKTQQPAETQPDNGDKKVTLFDLLSHYSKENAAAYKAQKKNKKETVEKAEKPEKKAKKNKKEKKSAPVENPVQPPVNNGGTPNVPYPTPGMNPTPGWQPPIQPIPVQNSFNETTVLSAFSGGETTVLSAESLKPEPHLTRVKTGERVVINKPVFRIGKEKSYVDYFIGDNTAISRSHANIHTDNGEYFIEDTNSTNHTYINGKIISSHVKTKLVSGDKVKLANEEFIFSL